MKKNDKLLTTIAFAVAFGIFTFITFFLFDITAYLLGMYCFSIAATILILAVILYYLKISGNGLKDFPANFVYFPVSLQHLIFHIILSIIFGVLYQFFGDTTIKYFVCLELLLLAVTIIRFILAYKAKNYIINLESRTQSKMSDWKNVRRQVSALSMINMDDGVKQHVEEVADAIRFSDPIGTNASLILEAEIQTCIDQLEKLLRTAASSEEIQKIARKIIGLIEKRSLFLKDQK